MSPKSLSGSVNWRIAHLLVLMTLLVSLTRLLFGCSGGGVRGLSPASPVPGSPRLRVATTTSLYDTGLWGYLEPMFEKEYGVALDVISTGSGRAFEYGMKGDVDALTAHDRANEERFIVGGYGLKRIPFAYNYFIIVGPSSDPAGIGGMKPEDALRRLFEEGLKDPARVKFVSRGDNSGTHGREKAIWEAAGFDYKTVQVSEWSKAREAGYLETGRGMGETLQMAAEKKAYTLTDIGTYLAYRGKLEISPLVTRGAMLLNVYSVIAVNPGKVRGVNSEMANELVSFLTSNETQSVIGSYGIKDYGAPLFTPLAGKPEPTE